MSNFSYQFSNDLKFYFSNPQQLIYFKQKVDNKKVIYNLKYRYKKLYGYCKSDEFEAVPSAPKSEYLNKTINVTFSANGGQGSFNPPSDLQIEALYYGGYRHGANFYSYVLCRGAFCYVEGANDDYPLNEYEEQTNSSDNGGEKSENGANSTGLIIFIVILAVALVAVGALAFSSKRKFE